MSFYYTFKKKWESISYAYRVWSINFASGNSAEWPEFLRVRDKGTRRRDAASLAAEAETETEPRPSTDLGGVPQLPTPMQTLLHYSEPLRPRGQTPVYPNPRGADLKAAAPTD